MFPKLNRNPFFTAGAILISLFLFAGVLLAVGSRPETGLAVLCLGGFVPLAKRFSRMFAWNVCIVGAVYTEPNYLSDIILHELDMEGSREQITVLSGQNLTIGTVVGKVTMAGVTETHAGNTGDGAMTIDVATPRLANCQLGVYSATCLVAVPGGGTFRVTDPKGNVLGDVVVGGTFQNQIKFVIAAGAVDFIEGDTFLITVAAGSGKIKILAPAATDGTQYAYGIVIADYDATSADLAGVAIVRDALAKTSRLVWPGGISAGEKAQAYTELAAKGITTRTDQ